MKRGIIALVVIAAIGGAAYYYTRADRAEAQTPNPGGGGPGVGGGFGPGGGRRMPMTVEVAAVGRANLAQELTIVGNLIGEATVEAVPKVSGRLESVFVRLGDRVNKGQR